MVHEHGARPESLRLSVHRRYVLDRQGHLRDQAFVQCPVEQQPVLLVECSRCGHCAASLADDRGALIVDCVPPDRARRGHTSDGGKPTNDPVVAAALTRALGLTGRDTLCIRADADLTHTAAAAQRLGTTQVAVVDLDLRPLGIVPFDAIDRAARIPPTVIRMSASDVMRPVRVTLPTDVTVSLAAAAMAETGSEEVPLVARDGDVIALLRAIDLIRWFASLEGYVLSDKVDPSLDAPSRHAG